MSLLPPDYGPSWMNQAARLTALRNLSFNPRSILDIGAYFGHWAGLAKHVWPAADILLIEANEDCRPQLTAKTWPFEIALLDSISREAEYHKCDTGCGEGNGLYRENSVFPFTTVKTHTKTLDEIAAGREFDFVKLDCQGAELQIIVGGRATIAAAQLVMIETQVQDYNEGAPRAADMITAMGVRGFRLYDIVDFHYNSRQMLLQIDLLFARADSDLFRIRPLS